MICRFLFYAGSSSKTGAFRLKLDEKNIHDVSTRYNFLPLLLFQVFHLYICKEFNSCETVV
jgi:hypothetical protein